MRCFHKYICIAGRQHSVVFEDLIKNQRQKNSAKDDQSFSAMNQKNTPDYQYDLISSPMMINRIVQKMLLPSISSDTAVAPYSASNCDIGINSPRDSYSDRRGLSRTATTLLDKSLPVKEIQKYEDVIKLRNSTPVKQ